MNLHLNIPKLYLIKITKWFMLFMPIVIGFFEENNLSFDNVMKLQAIHALSMVLFEIPSGYFSDRLGRKNTMIIACILGFIGFSTFSQAHLFWHFMIGNMFIGLGDSFISGTDSAMLYDTLFDMGKKEQYLKYESRIVSLGSYAEAFAAIVGGMIALQFGFRATYYGQAILALFAVITAISLVEPSKHKDIKTPSIRETFNVMFHSMFKHKILSWNIILSAIIGVATLAMAWFSQKYFLYIGIPVERNLYLWAGLNLVVGIVSWYAWKWERKMGKEVTTLLIIFGIGIVFWFMAPFTYWYAIGLLFFFYAIRGIATPVLRDYVQQYCPPELRATIMSIRSFLIRIIFIFFGILLGWMTKTQTIPVALMVSGSIVLFVSLICYWRLKVNGFFKVTKVT